MHEPSVQHPGEHAALCVKQYNAIWRVSTAVICETEVQVTLSEKRRGGWGGGGGVDTYTAPRTPELYPAMKRISLRMLVRRASRSIGWYSHSFEAAAFCAAKHALQTLKGQVRVEATGSERPKAKNARSRHAGAEIVRFHRDSGTSQCRMDRRRPDKNEKEEPASGLSRRRRGGSGS